MSENYNASAGLLLSMQRLDDKLSNGEAHAPVTPPRD